MKSRFARATDSLFKYGLTKRHIELQLRQEYMLGLKRGYALAVQDFFSKEFDEDWDSKKVGLNRTLGGLMRAQNKLVAHISDHGTGG